MEIFIKTFTLIALLVMALFVAAPVYADDAAKQSKSDAQLIDKTRSGADTGAGPHDAVRASLLMDKTVKDNAGNEIGTLSDILITPDGKVDFVVLSEGGGALGIGDKTFKPIPWEKVQVRDISEDVEAITVSLDKQKLEGAPVFSENEWQSFIRGERDREVRGYYGTEEGEKGSYEKHHMKYKNKEHMEHMRDEKGKE